MKQSMKLLLLIMSFGVIANAQNAKEGIQNTKQILEGKKMLERDMKELQAMNVKYDLFKAAFDAKDSGKANEIKLSLMNDMIREAKQSEEKAKMARKEVAQSSSEIRSDRREIQQNKDDSKRGRYDHHDDKQDMARDQANKRDDKRDRRDDINDFNLQIARAESQATILKSIKSYNFNFDNVDTSLVNKKLLDDFFTTMKQDIEATKIEIGEDTRESREDGRERRDDRNERNEVDTRKRRY